MNIEDYKINWRKKPVLRAIYFDIYNKIEKKAINSGVTLEIGSGIGNLKINGSKVIKSDIQHTHEVDIVADAHKLPFDNEVFSNIVLFDALHHLQCPILFFKEASRVLKPGGRIIMSEPGITPISSFFYKIAHEEPVDMQWKMNNPCKLDPNKDPYESNQAIPTILFKRDADLFEKVLKPFKINTADWLSLFAYPLSGGFKSWSLMPKKIVRIVLKIEEKLLPLLGGLMAFRLFVVLEKKKI
jgi:SAM-dependent methyltransferase